MNKVPYTLGCGYRFGRQGKAQLMAYIEAAKRGIPVSPVWNKSNRMHVSVMDIDSKKLPSAETVSAWSSSDYVNALRHDLSCPEYNPSFRQLIHVAYELGDEYLQALNKHAEIIGRNVMMNLLDRHICPIFR